MLAYDFPILGLFWTMVMIFLWVAWIMVLFHVVVDVFRSEMGGFAKALWVLFVIVLPLLGVLIYLIANGDDMRQRAIDDARRSDEALRSYVRDAAGSGGGTATELSQLADLRERGVLSDAEFEAQKAKLLAD